MVKKPKKVKDHFQRHHPVSQQIVGLLEEAQVWFETFEHPPVRTSEEAARLRPNYTLQQGAKAMIVRVRKSKTEKFLAMLVLPGDLRFDNDRVKTHFGAADIRLATPDEVSEVTGGVEVGGVPPFGNLFGLKVVVDPKLLEQEKIIFNAGDRAFSVAMRAVDYHRLVNPQVVAITGIN